MVGTRPIAAKLSPIEHAERAGELALIADQWMNLDSHYRADACATLAVAHMYAARMQGTTGDNPKDFGHCETPAHHIGRALATMTGAENALARSNYAQADSLASVAVMHFVAATMTVTDSTEPLPKLEE